MLKNGNAQNSKSYLKTSIVLLFFFLISLTSSSTIYANTETDSLKYKWDRFSISFGGFLAGMNDDIIFGSKQVGLGVSINLEDALGLKTSSLVLRSDASYRFGKRLRSSAKFSYYGLFRDSRKVLETEIEVGDEVFPVGTELNSLFNLQVFKGTYDWAFYKDKRVKFGLSAGLFVMPIRFKFVAKNIPEVKTNFTAPLPVVGISSDIIIRPKIHIKQSIEFLYLSFTNFRGVLTDFNLRLEYNPWDHWGFGLGINSFNLQIAIKKESDINLDFIGTIETSFTGILFYGRYFF